MGDELGRAGPYVVYKADNYLYFEHEELGEDDSCCVWLDGKKVTDYDSCFVLPDEVGAWLSRWGYSVYYNFEHSYWDLED
jgi:hypothetical protein